jgi:hypothetical protein
MLRALHHGHGVPPRRRQLSRPPRQLSPQLRRLLCILRCRRSLQTNIQLSRRRDRFSMRLGQNGKHMEHAASLDALAAVRLQCKLGGTGSIVLAFCVAYKRSLLATESFSLLPPRACSRLRRCQWRPQETTETPRCCRVASCCRRVRAERWRSLLLLGRCRCIMKRSRSEAECRAPQSLTLLDIIMHLAMPQRLLSSSPGPPPPIHLAACTKAAQHGTSSSMLAFLATWRWRRRVRARLIGAPRRQSELPAAVAPAPPAPGPVYSKTSELYDPFEPCMLLLAECAAACCGAACAFTAFRTQLYDSCTDAHKPAKVSSGR